MKYSQCAVVGGEVGSAEMKNIFMPERGGLRNMTFTRQAAVFVSVRHGNHSGGENTAKRSGDVFTVRRPARSESQIQLFVSSSSWAVFSCYLLN